MKNDKERSRAWRQANPDKVREYKRLSYERNREKARAAQAAYYQKNKEKRLADTKARRIANPEEHRAEARRYRAKYPEKVKTWQKNFFMQRRANVMAANARRSAKAKGVECNLDVAWFEERLKAGVCEMSGIPFDLSAGSRNPNSPSIDRIVAGGPYTKANCRLTIWWLNRALSNMGDDYCLDVFRRILQRRGEMPAPCLRLVA
jgi:hypothetical protein